ncbi:preprotein translocase subunit SecG [Treponema sp.]|uniref:preprotein translocase subunit SecG n=1 Tax=Treponema sp. TaxID=166 RepID=UPI003890D059
MDIIKGVLIVAFVIICILLVLLVLVQDQDNSGMGGMLGGGNSAAFGSHSASVLTKVTVAFVILFFVVTFCIAKALPSKSDSTDAALRAAAEESGVTVDAPASSEESSDGRWWDDSEKTEKTENTAETTEAPVETAETSAQ